MARIRTIKPEFWTDEKIVTLPYEVRLFFIGMWNFADDEGYLEDQPERLRMQVLPGDEIDAVAVVDLLVAAELVERVEVEGGRTALRVGGFAKHQVISNPSKSRISPKVSGKVSIPMLVRREVAEKYKCPPGGSADIQCYFCGKKARIWWPNTSRGQPGYWVSFSGFELAHFQSEANGGETSSKNMVLSCQRCNRSMQTKDGLSYIIQKNLDSSVPLQIIHAGMEWNGKEGNGTEQQPCPAEAPDGSDPEKLPEGFMRFWAAYPKRRRQARKNCLRIWKKKKLEERADAIVSIVLVLSKTEDWKKSGGQFVPLAATFLNQDRYDTDPGDVSDADPRPQIVMPPGWVADQKKKHEQEVANANARRQAAAAQS